MCALCGVCACIVWEFFSAVGALFAEKRLNIKNLQIVFDFLFVTSAGLALMLLCYYFNKGEIRFFAFLGFFSVFAIFKILLGRAFKCMFCAILRIFYAIICAVFKPFRLIFKYLVNKLQKIIQFVWKVLEKVAFWVYNKCTGLTMLKKSREGFLDKR